MTRLLGLSIIAALFAPTIDAQMIDIGEQVVNLERLSPPITITQAHAGAQPPQWASQEHKNNPPQPGIGVPLYMQVKNNSSKTIRAYRVMIAAYDPFGEYLDTIRAIAVVNLSPKSSDYGRWTLSLRYPWSTVNIVVYPNAVVFEDGTEWRLDDYTAAAYVIVSTTVRFETWHIMARPQEVLPVKMKDSLTPAPQRSTGQPGPPQ